MPVEWSQFVNNGEHCEVQYYNDKHEITYMIITKNRFRDMYYLIDVSTGERKEIAQAESSSELEKEMEKFKEGER